MLKLIARKKIVTAAMSAMLVATAFQPGGCLLNVDESVLQQLFGLLDGEGPGFVSGEGEFSFQGGSSEGDRDPGWGECDGDHEGGWDGSWNDGPDDDEGHDG